MNNFVSILYFFLLVSGSFATDSWAKCEDQWWECYMNSWKECSTEKVMDKYKTPLDYRCVQGLMDDNGCELMSCLTRAECFKEGKDHCDCWNCGDVHKCGRWPLCYNEAENSCYVKLEECFGVCENEHSNEEPDCVEVECMTEIEKCVSDVGCMSVVQNIDGHQLCDEEKNGGHSCFDDGYQQELCNKYCDEGEACFMAFKPLATCYEKNCYGKEKVDGEEHFDQYDYYNDGTSTHDYHYYSDDVGGSDPSSTTYNEYLPRSRVRVHQRYDRVRDRGRRTPVRTFVGRTSSEFGKHQKRKIGPLVQKSLLKRKKGGWPKFKKSKK